MSLSPQIHQSGILFVIGRDKRQGPVSVIEEDFTGKGHLEPRSYVDGHEKRPNPVTVLVNAGSHLGEFQNRSARHSEHFPILLRVDDRQVPAFGHPEPGASFPLEGVPLSIIPTGKLHSLTIKVWLNIRARIYRPVHSVPAYLKRVSFLHSASSIIKQSILVLFSSFHDNKLPILGEWLFSSRFRELICLPNKINGERVRESFSTRQVTHIGDVSTRTKCKLVFTGLSTASLPVGGL